MSEPSNEKSITETLNVIRKALQDDNIQEKNNDILLLNQLITEDGKIKKIDNDLIDKEEIKKIFDEKLTEIFEQYFEKWLNTNIPNYLEKYFSKKEK
tara:strand:+ start:28 stop:318 length:291 start_codon:yes stop_codon:yes gene_type:complete